MTTLPHVNQGVGGKQPNMLEEALAYARAGLAVLPLHTPQPLGGCSCSAADCEHVGKHPRVTRGYWDATTNPKIIREWWRRWPDANIGVAAKQSGLIAIDPDTQALDDWAEFARHEDLPPTLTANTGGGGQHVLYGLPEGVEIGNGTGSLPAGVDVRVNGYIVGPPSLHKSGKRYQWVDPAVPIAPLPLALIEMLKPICKKKSSRPRRPARSRGYTTGPSIPEGDRNKQVFRIGSGMVGRGLRRDDLEDALLETNQNRCRPPLPDAEVLKIARSAERYEPSI